jgi:peptide/nickel transport system substrate-binding protein
LNSRIVLERNDNYWGPKAKIPRVTIEIIKDPSARVAAIQSGAVDWTVNVPVREVQRFGDSGFAASLQPITRVILLQVRNDLAFADKNVRLAAHHAIDKAALSKAFYAGAAVPLTIPATPGTPGYLPDFTFSYDPELAKQYLAKSNFSPGNPVKIGFAATNGQFPSDYDIARAIVQMWKRVGIEANLEVIEYAKYFELNRAVKLPEATLYSWDNATGDPEFYAGYLLNPKLPFSAWKGEEIGQKVLKLLNVADYNARVAGYRELNRFAVEDGATMPLLQSVLTVVHKKELSYTKYGNGWMLAQTLQWT